MMFFARGPYWLWCVERFAMSTEPVCRTRDFRQSCCNEVFFTAARRTPRPLQFFAVFPTSLVGVVRLVPCQVQDRRRYGASCHRPCGEKSRDHGKFVETLFRGMVFPGVESHPEHLPQLLCSMPQTPTSSTIGSQQ